MQLFGQAKDRQELTTARAHRAVALSEASLFLDLDGTLASFEAAPDLVGPDPLRSALIVRLARRLEGRLAIVSGRSVVEVDRILEGAAPCVAGIHGLERRSGSRAHPMAPCHPALPEVDEAFGAIAKARPGLLVETKPMSVALHYRNAPDAGEAVRELAQRLALQHGLLLQEGVMVAELRTPGPDKGDAVRAFMEEATFAASTPIFVGDDLTDEAGFEAVSSLGGFGVIVGARTPTAAFGRLASPQDVMTWISDSLDEGVFCVEEPS